MATQRITERFALTGGKLDREAGVLRGAVICGYASENGRDYPWGGKLKGAHALYEGAVTNCDHGADDAIDRRFGWWQNVTPGADGKPVGDFHMLQSHPMYARVCEAAEKNPRLYGFSHVIEAETRRQGGREIVESIRRVVSIDLVATPATTKGLFESTGSRAVEKIPFRRVIEAAIPKLPAEKQKPARKWLVLAEDDSAMAPMLDAPVDAPADDATGDDAMDDAFKQLMHTSLDKLLDESHSLGEFLKNVRAIYKTRAQVTGNGKATDDAGDDAGKSEAKLPDKGEVIAECKDAQFVASYEQGEQLREIPSKPTRAAVIAAWKAAAKATAAETPVSHGRERARLTEDKTAAGQKPARVTLD